MNSILIDFDQNSVAVQTPTLHQTSMLPIRDPDQIKVNVHPTDRTDYSFRNVSIAGREVMSHKEID